MRGELRLAAATMAALLSAGGAYGDGSAGRAIISYQTSDYGFFTTRGVRQRYDFRLGRTLAEPLRLNIFLRAEDFRGSSDIEPGQDSRTSSLRVQPGVEVFYTTKSVQAGLRTDYSRTRNETGSTGSTRNLSNSLGTFSWLPHEGVAGSFFVERRGWREEATNLHRTEDLAGGQVRYEAAGFRISGAERVSRTDDRRGGFVRTSVDHQAGIAFDDTFFAGRLTAVADVQAIDGTASEKSIREGEVLVPNPVHVSRALWAIDDTPLDSSDHPLSPLPGLIDGDLGTNTSLSIGPDGSSFLGIALDLQRAAEVDEIRVVVRDTAGNPVRVGGGIRWDVYTSDDGQRWLLSTPAPAVTFDPALSHYQISFPLITTRWVKVVNFGVNIEPAWITEVLAYYHTVLRNDRDVETKTRLYTGTTSITARPVRWATIGYTGLFNSHSNRRAGVDVKTEDTSHSSSVRFDPFRRASLEFRWDSREVEHFGSVSQSYDGWTGLLRLVPTGAVDATLEYSVHDERVLGIVTESKRTALHLTARVIPAVNLALDVGRQRQDLVSEGYVVTRSFVAALAHAELYTTLRLTASASVQRADREADVVLPGFSGPRDDRYWAELYWRPGRPLAISSRLGRAMTGQRSDWTQQYRIEWYPFADGTVSIGAIFDHDVDPLLDRESRRLILNPRWSVNRHAILDLNYTAVTTSGGVESELSTYFAALTLTR